jgi:hypothetical protein
MNVNLPDYVFEHSVMISISEATNDILTWPNVGAEILVAWMAY